MSLIEKYFSFHTDRCGVPGIGLSPLFGPLFVSAAGKLMHASTREDATSYPCQIHDFIS